MSPQRYLPIQMTAGWRPPWTGMLALAVGAIVAFLPMPVALAVLSLAAFLVVCLIKPLFGLAIVLLAGPAGALENHVLGVNLPESGQLLLLVTVGAWVLHGVLRRRIILHKTPLNAFFAVFIFIGLVSLVPAKSLSYGLKEVVKWLEMWLVMQMVLDLSIVNRPSSDIANTTSQRWQSRFDVRWLAAMLLAAGLSQALIGMWQFALSGDGPEHFMILDRFYRAFGTFQQPNPYGGYMGITASLALGATAGMLFSLWRRLRSRQAVQRKDWLWLAFFGFSASLTTMGLIMSWSRGAWLGFAAGMVVFLLFLPRRRLAGLALLVASTSLLIVAFNLGLIPSSLSSRLISFSEDLQVGDVRGVHITIENYAVIERLAHWQAGADMAREELLTGVGFGNYEPTYEEFALLNWPIALGHAHNYYLNILAETGLPGGLAYLLLWALILWQAARQARSRSWRQKGLALGLLAAWTALSVHHLFDKLYVNNLYLYFGAMLGLQQVLAVTDD